MDVNKHQRIHPELQKPGGLNSTSPGLAHLSLAHAGFWFPVQEKRRLYVSQFDAADLKGQISWTSLKKYPFVKAEPKSQKE